MFYRPTVLILGAGASKPYGLPLGTDLLDDLRMGLREFVKDSGSRKERYVRHLQEISGSDEPVEIVYDLLRSVQQKPATDLNYDLLGNLNLSAESDVVAVFRKLEERLKNQAVPSIDEFFRRHRDLASLGKLFVAITLLLKTVEKRPNSGSFFRTKSELLRPTNQDHDWYADLSSQIIQNADRNDLTKKNLTVLTFNYDATLEAYLESQIGHCQLTQGINYTDLVDVVHVYGKLPPLLKNNESLEFWRILKPVIEASPEISLMDERSDSAVQEKIQTAFRKAQHLYAAGFAADPSNISYLRIGNTSLPALRNARALNYDGNLAVSDNLSRLWPKSSVDIIQPRGHDPQSLTIASALRNGFLREALSPN